MTQSGRSRLWTTLGRLTTFAALVAAACCAQRSFAQTTLKGGVSQSQYTDPASDSCEKQNANNPYTGMNPLACYGEMAPSDSNGQCTLNIGSVWKKTGNTCYYCSPINPPIQGIIVPMDEVGAAEQQGYRCGADQADVCMAICSGGTGFRPTIPGGVQSGGGTPGKSVPQGGPPPGYAPHPGPPPVAGASNPCLPFGPGGYDYCANPPGTQPAGCICSKTPPKTLQGGTISQKPPSNPIADTGDYLHGVVDGFGVCFKGIGGLMAGAGFFANGDFVNAAKAWGLSPGQSVVLKTMYTELTTLSVGKNITPYNAGVTAGRRLCAYAVIPGAAKAAGTAIKAATSAPGATLLNPVKGTALQEAIDTAPQSIANKWVQTAKGPVQLGGYAGQGSFATVFNYGKASVIKFGKTTPGAMGYGPESIEGQASGAARAQASGVATPNVSNVEPGGSGNPASLVADDVTKIPNSFQLSNTKFHTLTPTQQSQVLGAVQNAANQLTKNGYVLIDVNPGNFTMQIAGNTIKAILHDPDMIMSMPELHALTPTQVRWGVLDTALDVAGQPKFLSQPFTVQSLTDVLNVARQRMITGITNVPSDTVAP